MRRPGGLASLALASVGAVACGPAARPAPGAEPRPALAVDPAEPADPVPLPADPAALVPIASEVEPAYPPAGPVMSAACATASAPRRSTRAAPSGSKMYDFEPIEIPPAPYGPRIGDLPVERHELRSTYAVRDLRDARRRVIHDCYRWALWKRPGWAGTMTLDVELDVLGGIANVTVASPEAWGELGQCVAEALPAAYARTFVPRATHVTLEVELAPSGQARPARRPARPARAKRPAPPAACAADRAAALAVTPDAVTHASPRVTVDDFDREQAAREEQEAACKAQKAAGARRCRVVVAPIVGPGGVARVAGDVDKSMIRATIGYHRAAFGTCFADARARRPDAADEVGLTATIAPDGTPAAIAVEQASADPVLDACVQAAFAELRFPRASGGGPYTLHVPLRAGAVPPAVPSVPDRAPRADVARAAAAAAAAGDVARALRHYTALRTSDDTCAARVDELRALVAARPWIDDGVIAAVEAHLAAPSSSGPCEASMRAEVIRLAVHAHQRGLRLQRADLLEQAVERYLLARRIRVQPDGADDAADLIPFLAEALYGLGRSDLAERYLAEVPGATAAEPR